MLKNILKSSIGFNAGLIYGSVISTVTSIIVLTSLGSSVGLDLQKFQIIQDCMLERLNDQDLVHQKEHEIIGSVEPLEVVDPRDF